MKFSENTYASNSLKNNFEYQPGNGNAKTLLFQVQEPQASNQIWKFMKFSYASDLLMLATVWQIILNMNLPETKMLKHYFVSGSRTTSFKSDLEIHEI